MLSVSAALQIAGRAGRYGTVWDTVSMNQFLTISLDLRDPIIHGSMSIKRTEVCFPQGYVTTFKQEDLSTLKNLLSQTPEIITQAGLHPTADQIELYAYHLPNSPLSNLMVCLAKKHSKIINCK